MLSSKTILFHLLYYKQIANTDKISSQNDKITADSPR